MLRLRTPLLLAALAASLAAQEAANRFVPKGSNFVVRMAAPAKWKSRFAGTPLQQLMQGPTMAPMMAQAGQAFDGMLEQLRQSGAFDADLVEKLLNDYQGDITLAVQLDVTGMLAAMAAETPPPFSLVLSLSPDGKFALNELAAGLEKAVEKATEGQKPLQDLQAGDVRLRVDTSNEGMHAAVPAMVDGHLVMLMGNDLEKNAAELLGSEGRMELAAGDSSLFVRADLASVMQAVMENMKASADVEGMPFDAVQMVRDFGLASLQTMELSVGNDGKQLAAEASLAFNDADAGLFGMMMVADQGQPKLLRYVPANADYFGVGAFDIGAIYRTAGKIWSGLGEAVPMSWEQAMAAFAEEMKVRLQEDLLAHVGTEMLSIGDVAAMTGAAANAEDEDAEPNPLAMMQGTCLGFSLRDGKAFGESLEKLLRARGLHAARKSEDYQGTKVQRLRLAGVVEMEYAVTDDLLLLAVGGDEGSRRNLRAVLDARAAAGAEAALPEALQKALKALPEGWNGVSITPVGAMLGGMQAGLAAMAATGNLPPEAEMMQQVFGGLAKDLQQAGLQNMVSATYTKGRNWMSRMRW